LFDFALRPIQRACADIPLTEGSMLAAGKGRGHYAALPTMATSDAMFARAEGIMGRLFDHPSLTLAHGKAGFRDLVAGRHNAPEKPQEPVR